MITLTANQTSGWTYIQTPDPGAGWKLAKVIRSDGTVILVGPDAWQTDKVFNSTTNTFDDDPELHLFDFNGTGSYTLSYVKDDSTPPTITQIQPVSPDPRNSAVDSVNVTFSEEIDPTTFDYHAITLDLQRRTESDYECGDYNACFRHDLSNQRIDRPHRRRRSLYLNGRRGRNSRLGRQCRHRFNVNRLVQRRRPPPFVKQIVPVAPAIRNTPVDAINVQLSLPIDPGSFNSAALQLTRDGQSVSLPAGMTVTEADNTGTNYQITGLAAATRAEGTYSLAVNATEFQGIDGLSGLGSKSAGWTMDTTSPNIVSVAQPQSPRNIVVQYFNVTFSEPINLSTFDRSHMVLTLNGTAVPLDDRVLVQAVSGAVYQITGLNWFMGAQGTYTLTVDSAGVQDLAGNVGSGAASATWVMDTSAPDAPTNVALTPDRGVSATDGLTNTGKVTITGNVDAPGLNVRVYDFTTGQEIGFAAANGLTFAVPINVTSVGHHVLWVNAVDVAGNDSDNTVLDAFIDETPPSIVQFNGVPATPTQTPVDAIDVVFTKVINLSTLNYHALSLTLNGGPNLIGTEVTVEVVSDTTYRISGLSDFNVCAGHLSADRRYHQGARSGRQRRHVSLLGFVDGYRGRFNVSNERGITSPAKAHTFNFTVQWSGQDNPGGSGIAYYDVYSDVDGGPFSLWQQHTTANSATFTGSDQHTYGFFSVATDFAGNLEPMKFAADSKTFVSIQGVIQGRVFNDVNQTGNDLASAQNGLQGWTVFLDLQDNGHLDPGDPTTTTAADGSFSFSGLDPGTYQVGEVLQQGWQQTYPSANNAAVHSVSVNVTASDAAVYLADVQTTGSNGGVASSTASNQSLIGLDQFHDDPRFRRFDRPRLHRGGARYRGRYDESLFRPHRRQRHGGRHCLRVQFCQQLFDGK